MGTMEFESGLRLDLGMGMGLGLGLGLCLGFNLGILDSDSSARVTSSASSAAPDVVSGPCFSFSSAASSPLSSISLLAFWSIITKLFLVLKNFSIYKLQLISYSYQYLVIWYLKREKRAREREKEREDRKKMPVTS